MTRYGKFIWLQFKDGGAKIHFNSTGWFTPANNDAAMASVVDPIVDNFIHVINKKGVRLRLHFDDGQIWNYHDPRTWGCMTYVPGCRSMYDEEQISNMGPDWLLDEEAAHRAWVNARTSRAAKDVMCDQRLAAGVGNYLACEVMHLAGVYPREPWNNISQEKRHELGVKAAYFLRECMNADDHEHWRVFLKKGKTCPTCGEAEIDYVKDGNAPKARGSYFCPACQPSLRA